MVWGISFGCFFMAVILALTDPLDFNPDPFQQALVWAGFGVWCAAAAWRLGNWQPPPDRD